MSDSCIRLCNRYTGIVTQAQRILYLGSIFTKLLKNGAVFVTGEGFQNQNVLQIGCGKNVYQLHQICCMSVDFVKECMMSWWDGRRHWSELGTATWSTLASNHTITPGPSPPSAVISFVQEICSTQVITARTHGALSSWVGYPFEDTVHIISHLWGKSPFLSPKANDMELWWFLCFIPKRCW